MATVAELLVKISADIKGLENGVGQSIKSINKLSDESMSLSKSITKGVGASLGIAGTALIAFGTASVKAAADMEQTKTAFGTLLGSADKAEKMLSDLADFAAKTPFELSGLQTSSKQLLAFGFAADDVIPMMTNIGDAVSALGGGEEEISRVVRALGQMKAKGKVSAEEMMQLSEMGINGYQLLADKLGITVPEAMDKASKGAIDSSTAINAILEGMGTKFGGAMEDQSKTLNGMWSNIKDTASQTMIAIGEEIITNLNIKDFLSQLSTVLTNFRELQKQVGTLQALGQLIPEDTKTTIVIVAGAIMGAMVPALMTLATTTWAALVPLLPFIAAGVLIAGLAYTIIKNWSGITKFFKDLGEGIWTGVTDTWNSIIKFFNDTWTKTKAFFSKWGPEIITIIAPFIGIPLLIKKHWGAISGFFTEIKNKTLNTINSMVKGVQGIVSELPSILSSVWKRIIDYVKGLPGQMSSIAKNIAGSFWKGFKKGLGISSPSYVEVAFMNMVSSANDMVKGIKASVPRFEAQAARFASPFMSAVGDIGLASAGAYGVGIGTTAAEAPETVEMPGGFTIRIDNLSVRDDTDIEKIAEKLYRLQQSRLRAKGGRL